MAARANEDVFRGESPEKKPRAELVDPPRIPAGRAIKIMVIGAALIAPRLAAADLWEEAPACRGFLPGFRGAGGGRGTYRRTLFGSRLNYPRRRREMRPLFGGDRPPREIDSIGLHALIARRSLRTPVIHTSAGPFPRIGGGWTRRVDRLADVDIF